MGHTLLQCSPLHPCVPGQRCRPLQCSSLGALGIPQPAVAGSTASSSALLGDLLPPCTPPHTNLRCKPGPGCEPIIGCKPSTGCKTPESKPILGRKLIDGCQIPGCKPTPGCKCSSGCKPTPVGTPSRGMLSPSPQHSAPSPSAPSCRCHPVPPPPAASLTLRIHQTGLFPPAPPAPPRLSARRLAELSVFSAFNCS